VAEAQAKVDATAQKYKDVKKASGDASKAGIDGAKGVIDAQQRLSDAQAAQAKNQRDLADARRQQTRDQKDAADALLNAQDRLVRAQEAQNTATTKVASATAAADNAMSKLAPAAVAVVNAIRGLGPAWHEVHLEVQQALLDGIGARITALGTNALPTLRTGLVGIATELNAGTKAFLGFAANADTAREFSTLFDNIQASVHALLPTIRPANQALLDLVTVGSKFGPQLATGVAVVHRTGVTLAERGGEQRVATELLCRRTERIARSRQHPPRPG
jgi:hypothetical protein